MWVVSKLSGVSDALGVEEIEIRNWIVSFVCVSEELKGIVSKMDEWMSDSSPPCAAYCALMACRLVALNKNPGVRPVVIGEMLRRSLAKIVMRAAGYQGKTACGNLQLCTGLEEIIEGETHAGG